MISKVSAYTAGLALLVGVTEAQRGKSPTTAQNTFAAGTHCVLKPNPPAGANCGVRGYLTNENSYDVLTQLPQYQSPTGCAAGCAARPNCVSWYMALDYNWCEWHTDTTAAAGFYATSNSYYYGFDQACYDCTPQSPECPSADGTQFTVNGAIFNVHCGVDYYGGDIGHTAADTFGDCMKSCATTSGCLDVAYNGHDCYMKSSLTTPRQNGNVWGAVLASAEQAASNLLKCPRDNGKTYHTKAGDQFQVQCGVDYYGGDMGMTNTNSFDACLEACDTTPGCVNVAWHDDSQNCYLKNVVTPAMQDANVYGASKVANQPIYRVKRGDADAAALPMTAKFNPNFVEGNETLSK